MSFSRTQQASQEVCLKHRNIRRETPAGAIPSPGWQRCSFFVGRSISFRSVCHSRAQGVATVDGLDPVGGSRLCAPLRP